MSESLRICAFDAECKEEKTGHPFRLPFGHLKDVDILGETSTWEELAGWLRLTRVDIVAVNLDDDDNEGLRVVQRIVSTSPSCSIIGVSQNTEPAAIISAMREGCSQYVPWPIDAADLRNAVERIRASRQVALHRAKRICVIGSSGGVGATTIASNLAIELAHLTNRQSALVDMNLEFGDIACAFDTTPRYSIADVCTDGTDVDRMMLGKAVTELPCNVSILARPDKIEEAREVTPEGVRNMFTVMGSMFPFVVVDLPRAFSFLSAAAVAEADRVLIVMQLSVPSVRNSTRIFDCLTQMGAEDDRVEIVLNRYKANHARISPDEVETHFGRPIFSMIPNDFRRVQASLDFGHPVMADAPNSPARLAIQEMAKMIASDNPNDDATPRVDPANSGIFGRWWKKTANQSS